MRVHIGADHAALDLKSELIEHIRSLGHEPVDHGPYVYDALDDFPVFVLPTALAVLGEPDSLGIVLGGSGNGEQIAANKVPGIRAALGHSLETAVAARDHNNAQILAIGSRTSSVDLAKDMVQAFLDTPFSGDERHMRRIDMLSRWEQVGELPQERP